MNTEECRLCNALINIRQQRIRELKQFIKMYEDEISEVERGERHDAYHRMQQRRLSQENPQ